MVGALEREQFRVVLLDEYQDTSVAQALMLSRLFSGPDGETGRGHPVTAVGDPNQAIYGWRGASVSNILRFGEDFPRHDGGDVPTYPLTRQPPLRPAHPRRRQPARRSRSTTVARQVEPLAAGRDAPTGTVQAPCSTTYADELAWLAGQVPRPRTRPSAAWREIGVLIRDNAHAADVFDALTAARRPGRDRRPQGPAPPARGRRGASRRSRCSTTSPPTPSCSPC